jgi:hypothetical protein
VVELPCGDEPVAVGVVHPESTMQELNLGGRGIVW